MATNVLIADDHQILRQGLRSLLERQPDMRVIAEAADGRHALTLIEEHAPEIAVIDVSMPELDGIETTRQICSKTSTKVVALSAHGEPRFVRDMLKAGASAYLLKDDAFEELAIAIREVMAGGTYFSKRIDQNAVSGKGAPAGSIQRLTPREREVLQLMSEGQSTKEIAFRLKLSTKTIETHRRQIMQKLDVYSVAELTKCAIREGLTTLELSTLAPLGRINDPQAVAASRN
jgi:DNA-binding NarL/FixJ family response regulator